MSCLVELFVVVDAKYGGWRWRRDSGDCWWEEARRDVRHHDKRRQTVKIRKTSANREARNLGIVPFDGEGDGTGTEGVEVIAIVGVLPDVLAAQDEILAEGLLEASVEFVAKTSGQGESNAVEALGDGHDGKDCRIATSGA